MFQLTRQVVHHASQFGGLARGEICGFKWIFVQVEQFIVPAFELDVASCGGNIRECVVNHFPITVTPYREVVASVDGMGVVHEKLLGAV